MDRKKALTIVGTLKGLYPRLPKSFLEFSDPFQLLISVILSAQCTDKMVNQVTPGLFAKYPDAASLAAADPEKVMELIKPTGFYRNKAANIMKCAADLAAKHGGKVPRAMEELTALAGVGRKTANVVLQIAYDITVGVVIDTHVKRLSNRIGFSSEDDPEKIEADLMKLLPESEWKDFSFYLILHGRGVCDARAPKCSECAIADSCSFYGSSASAKSGGTAELKGASRAASTKGAKAKNGRAVKPATEKNASASKKARGAGTSGKTGADGKETAERAKRTKNSVSGKKAR